MRMTSAGTLTLEPARSSGPARRRGAHRIRLGGRKADDDGVARLQVTRDDLREPAVGDPRPDLHRSGLAFRTGRFVAGRRPRSAGAAAPVGPLPGCAAWPPVDPPPLSPPAFERSAVPSADAVVTSGFHRSAALGTLRTSFAVATSIVTLAVIVGRSMRSGLGTSTMTG